MTAASASRRSYTASATTCRGPGDGQEQPALFRHLAERRARLCLVRRERETQRPPWSKLAASRQSPVRALLGWHQLTRKQVEMPRTLAPLYTGCHCTMPNRAGQEANKNPHLAGSSDSALRPAGPGGEGDEAGAGTPPSRTAGSRSPASHQAV